jgi:hypothetical protein
MSNPSAWQRQARACAAIAAALLAATAFAEGPIPGPQSNRSPTPDAPYGRCHDAPSGSAIGSKVAQLGYLQESVEDVIAIQLLHCTPYNGGPGLRKVPCGSVEAGGVPYAYCFQTHNDGLGNDIAMGVLRRDAATDALGTYTGCPAGQSSQSKLALAQAAGVDPRRVDGIVTLGCRAAAAGAPTGAAEVPCPPPPHPYAQCVGTRNDGHGNAVVLGVVASHGSGDTNALYGECNTYAGIAPGFLYKADALRAAGVSLANVRNIDVTGCAVPWGIGGWLPDHFEKWACSAIPGNLPIMIDRYDYCVVGTDVHGNGAIFGVNGAH